LPAKHGTALSRRIPANAILVLPAIAALVLLLVLPVGYLLLLSFNAPVQGDIELKWEFTVSNYSRLLSDSFYLWIVLRSILVAAITTLVAAAAGYLLALSLWRAPKAYKSYLIVLVLAPLLISVVVRTYGWMVILGDKGVLNTALISLGIVRQPLEIMFTRSAVVIGLVHVLLPFMALSILSSLERIDPSIPEAAKTLGAKPWSVHWRVIVPLATPGFAAGVTIVFSFAVSAYVTPMLMGRGATDMITTVIYQQFMTVFNWHFGAALTTALLTMTLIVMSVTLYVFSWRTRAWLSQQ
jgi:putative spermidine/putrescine transport system permease protein